MCLGRRELNLHWFHIAIFPVTAVNPLKIRQYSLRNLLCYRKNCLCETASTCSAEFLQRISVRKGAGGLTPVKTDNGARVKSIQSAVSTDNIRFVLVIIKPHFSDFYSFINV